MNTVKASRLRELFSYSPESGLFTRRVTRAANAMKGDVAGKCLTKGGYSAISISGKLYLTHRLVWLYANGEFPSGEIDHINGNRSDNRICNLRDVTRHENCKNQKMRATNTSGVLGVSWCRVSSKWHSQMNSDGIKKCLGYYKYKWDAICARKSAEIANSFHVNHGRLV